MFQFISDVM